jgi:hypothetical protein
VACPIRAALIAPAGENRMRTLFGSPVLWIGGALLVIGSGPLLTAVLYEWSRGDTSANPVGWGILAFLTFWPSLILIVVGLGLGVARLRGWLSPSLFGALALGFLLLFVLLRAVFFFL